MNKCKSCNWFISDKCQCPDYPHRSPPRDPEFGCILWEPSRDNRPCLEATHDIFIRTYAKDLPWLRYCLQSIYKFCRGFRQVVITAPQSTRPALDRFNLTLERVHYVQDYANDYLGQQITKLHADTWSDADYIWFVDSDVIFNRRTMPDMMFVRSKPVVYFTPIALVGKDHPWGPVMEMFFGRKPQFEYMRRLPLVYPRDLLVDFRNYATELHKMSIDDWILHNQKFSEFNALGFYAHLFKPERMYFWHTEETGVPPVFANQYWSYSGVTPEIKAKLERELR